MSIQTSDAALKAAQQIPITISNTAFVDPTGNDSTGVIGNPGAPFLTAQAAYTALVTAFPFTRTLLSLGRGDYTITLSADWVPYVAVHGLGEYMSHLTVIADGSQSNPGGPDAFSGSVQEIYSTHIDLSANGADAIADSDRGGNGGTWYFLNCDACTVSAKGGNDSGSGYGTGNAGNGGSLVLASSNLRYINVPPSANFTGGSVSGSGSPGRGGTVQFAGSWTHQTLTMNLSGGSGPLGNGGDGELDIVNSVVNGSSIAMNQGGGILNTENSTVGNLQFGGSGPTWNSNMTGYVSVTGSYSGTQNATYPSVIPPFG